MRALACGPDGALALFHMELSPVEMDGLRIRLMQCAALWRER
jgi:hypothetical protein